MIFVDFGLRLPGSETLIQKPTRLLTSHENMASLERRCPGAHHPKHACHQQVAGSHPSVGSISSFTGKYTPAFVQAVMNSVPKYAQLSKCEMPECVPWSFHHEHQVMLVKDDLDQGNEETVKKALVRLHKNLGHPSSSDLVRLLKHAQASDQAIALARTLSCEFCQAQGKPHTPLPAQIDRPQEFNQVVGIDVKNLTGWRPNQTIKALNMVDHASNYQLMLPFHEQETSIVLQKLFSQWVKVFGPPKVVMLDPARTNLGEPMQQYLDQLGIQCKPIAAEAHWQLGRTERHGGWFGNVLTKLVQEYTPENKDDWDLLVTQAHVKNTMIQNHGFTPHQFVFGRNPSVPTELLDEPLRVVPATLGLTDAAIQKAQEIRATARKAIIDLQCDQSLRRALAARPRVTPDFQAGDLVAYWREQKYQGGSKSQKGHVLQGGHWFGTAVVMGKIGRNYVVAHRKQIFRVAPEQLRAATSEERTLLESPQAELLGIKDLLEGGTFRSHQYVDLVPGHYPTSQSEPPIPPGKVQEHVTASDLNSGTPETADVPMEVVPPDQEPELQQESNSNQHETEEEFPSLSIGGSSSSNPARDESSYGPVRRRIPQKAGEAALFRPAAMREQDFTDLMREMVPRILVESLNPSDSQLISETSGLKRSSEELENTAEEPPTTRVRMAESVHDEEQLLVEECSEVWDSWHPDRPIEVLMAAYLQKKLSKEIPHTNEDPKLQRLVDESKVQEWNTITEKSAVRIHYGKKAAKLKALYPHRFIGSRFVIIRKPAEENQKIVPEDSNTFRIKSRWCLQGHLDPDLEQKAQEGLLKSPTLNQISRMILMQLICSFGWDLQLGDIKGAFMEAGPLDDKFRPLFASHPPGGIPGVPSDAVIEVIGNVYGQNDAPASWFKTFHQEAVTAGWCRSVFDSCLYFLRDPNTNQLIGIMGVHVDDTAVGGSGPVFEKAIASLKARFPYRKWRVGEGEFCGSYYKQDKSTKEIHMSQRLFAESMRPANIPKGSANETKLHEGQIKVLRAINGSLNWIASQSRPDLAVQTSMCQQSFPHPTVRTLRDANNAIRRAKMNKDLEITFMSIAPEKLRICCHSDAAFANLGTHTQAGFILAFTSMDLDKGLVAPWTPCLWRSYKLPRAVSSTLGAESQSMACASGSVEWVNLLLCEALDGPFNPRESRSRLSRRPPVLATDCKSLFDHLTSPSAPTAVEDRRTSIDIVIIRESLAITQGIVRWLPTDRMLADGLTKDKQDPIDLLRSCIRTASYQISPENFVLAQQAAERNRRQKNRQLEKTPPSESSPQGTSQ